MTTRQTKGFAVVGPDGAIMDIGVKRLCILQNECEATFWAGRADMQRASPGHRVVPCTITWEEPEDE